MLPGYVVMKREGIGARTRISLEFLYLPVVKVEQLGIGFTSLSLPEQYFALQVCVTLLEPVGIRRILGLQALQVIRRRIGLAGG